MTTSVLAALCAGQDTPGQAPAAEAAYCRGFLVGIGQLHREVTTVRQIRPPLFCVPEPSPTLEQAQASFVAWVRAHPAEADSSAAIGVLRWASATYPCQQAPAAARRAQR